MAHTSHASSAAQAGASTVAPAYDAVAVVATYGLNVGGSGRACMETFLGTILIAAWAAVVLRGLARTILAARKGGQWERAYLVGLGVGCAFGLGGCPSRIACHLILSV